MFQKCFRFYVCLLLSVCVNVGAAEADLSVHPEKGRYELGPHIDFIVDQDWGFTDLQRIERSLSFSRMDKKVLSFGYVDGAYWLRFSVQSFADDNGAWLLELAGMARVIDEVKVYVPLADGQVLSYDNGDAIPFSKRRIKHHSMLFPIDLKPKQIQPVYVWVSTSGTLQIPAILWTMEAYIENEHEGMLLQGMFYGVIVIMLLYNGFIYWSVRDSSYLFYVFYLISMLGLALSLKGIGFEYFWPDSPRWNGKSNVVFAALGSLFTLLFARSFLKTRKKAPKIDAIIKVLMVTSAVCLINIFVLGHYTTASIMAVQTCVTVLTVIVAAFVCLNRGFKAARYYLLAWASILIAVFVWALNSFNIWVSYWLSSYLFQISIALQVLLFSFALADRITILRFEREVALKLQLAHSQQLVSMAAMFERFVPKQFLSRIAKTGIENIELGKAEEDVISVLFADIRGFTSLSEALKPQELLNFLNSYLVRMDKVIHKNDGFIDKFIGDAVMAIFEQDCDQHGALSCVTAAVEMQHAVDIYNQHRANSGYRPIKIGIGVNTGPVVIGTVGSKARMDTTVLGDNVNVAARLQDLTKQLKARVLISHHTLLAMGKGHGFILREVGDVTVRGRKEPVHLYEVINADEPVVHEGKLLTLANYRMAYDNFRNGRYQKAYELWSHCLESNPEDSVVTYLLEKCRISMEAHGLIDL